MSSGPLRLFLFTPDAQLALEAEKAGVSSIIIDWENQGKYERQSAHDTEVNLDTVGDLDRVVRTVKLPVTVRVNGGAAGLSELEVALDHGARVLMLPMARSAREVELFLNRVNGRAETLIQVETQPLVDDLQAFANLPWTYAYIGLNDLMISRGGKWLWEPVLDGTVEHIYRTLRGRTVGFGGVTVVGGGYPLRFTSLLREMARLGCGLSFLRRTFRKEIAGRDMGAELDAVRAVWTAAQARSPDAIEADHASFTEVLLSLKRNVLHGYPHPLAT